MKALLDHICAAVEGPVGTIVHAGAGTGTELPLYRGLKPKALVLYEPNPAFAEELRRKVRLVAGERVEEAAVNDGGGRATLKLLTIGRYGSLSAPTGLLDRLPNLKLDGEIEVAAVPAGAAFALPEGAERLTNLLVVETPGTVAAVLAACDPDLLLQYRYVVISAAEAPLYADEAAGDAAELLRNAGFRLTASDDSFPTLWQLFERDDAAQVVAFRHRLQSRDAEAAALAVAREQEARAAVEKDRRIAELADQCRTLEQQRDTRQAELAEAAAAYERLSAEAATLTQQLDGAIADTAAKDALAAQRGTEVEALTSARAAAEQAAAQHQARLEELLADQAAIAARCDTLVRETEELSATANAVRAERQAQAKLAADRQDELNTAADEQAALQARHDALVRQVTEFEEALAAAGAERDRQAKAAADARAQIAALSDAHALQTDALNQSRAAHDAVLKRQQEAAEQIERLSAKQHHLSDTLLVVKGANGRLEQEVARLGAELGAAKGLVNETGNQLMMRSSDYIDLQERYAKLNEHQMRQQDSLARLAGKLAEAQRYFDHIQGRLAEAESAPRALPKVGRLALLRQAFGRRRDDD